MRLIINIFVASLGLLLFTSCRDKSYPCPSTGKVSPSVLSAFDADGNPKKRKKYQDNGLINKKNPKKIRK